MVNKASSWKEYLNTFLLSVVSYLIIDMHTTFKEVIKDVETLKIKVEKHDYILNLKQGKNNEKSTANIVKFEAILPTHDKKYYYALQKRKA